jgi:hypothetical protein
MFSIDFEGSISFREVRVCDTSTADSDESEGRTQRALYFGSPANSSGTTVTGIPEAGPSQSPTSRAMLHPLHPHAPLLSDSDVDLDWLGEFQDLEPKGNPPSSPDSFPGEPFPRTVLCNNHPLPFLLLIAGGKQFIEKFMTSLAYR